MDVGKTFLLYSVSISLVVLLLVFWSRLPLGPARLQSTTRTRRFHKRRRVTGGVSITLLCPVPRGRGHPGLGHLRIVQVKIEEGYQGRPSPDNPLPGQSVMNQDTLAGTPILVFTLWPPT